MTLLRRFLLIQAMMLWQGGFLFYASFVVPVGTRVLGSAAEQGRITARVTDSLNICGSVALLVMLFDMIRGQNRVRFSLWLGMALLQVWLVFLHIEMDGHLDPGRALGRDEFYPLHRSYLISSTLQWTLGLVWMFLSLKQWHHFAPTQNSDLRPLK